MADLNSMKRQIALVKAQGVGDGVIVSTMELEALIAVAEAADYAERCWRGHIEEHGRTNNPAMPYSLIAKLSKDVRTALDLLVETQPKKG